MAVVLPLDFSLNINAPVTQIVPFTYRDNATFLEILHAVELYSMYLQTEVDALNVADSVNLGAINDQLTSLVTQFNAALQDLQDTDAAALAAQVASVNASLAAFDARLTDMFATSNVGLDARVTTAETQFAALNASITPKLATLPGYADPGEYPTGMLARLADTQYGSVTMAIAADSTANDPTDWVRIFTQMYGPLLTDPSLRREYKTWNAATQLWNAPIIDQAGTPTTAKGGVVTADSFTRSGEIVGSVPDTGAAWIGKVGTWTMDGAHAKQASALTGAIHARCLDTFGSPIRDMTLTANLILTTSASAIAQQWRFYVGGPALTSDSSATIGGVYVYLAVSTSGAVTAGLAQTINGVSTTILVFPNVAGIVSASGAAQNVTVNVSVSGLNVSGSLQKDAGAVTTVTGVLSETDKAWMGGYASVSVATTASPGYLLDTINITTPVIPAPPTPGLIVQNASVAGTTLLYQKSRLASLWPLKPDILVISTGHNYGDQSVSDFLQAVTDFIAACNTLWGSLPKIWIVSQNTEMSIQANYLFHARRQAALRVYASQNGYQYLPVFEMFTANPDPAMRAVDGTHPSVPAAYPLAVGDTTNYGSVAWANLAMNAVTARRFARL